MTHTDWRAAATALKRRSETVGVDQLDLARRLGLSLPRRIPALVAA
jgi:hypothetical protein